mgnify:CR=1 FL=1
MMNRGLVAALTMTSVALAGCRDGDDASADPRSLSPNVYFEVACAVDSDCTLATEVKDCSQCCTQGTRSVRDTERVRADYARVREVCNSSSEPDASPRGFSVCAAICPLAAVCRDGQCTTTACDPARGCGGDAGL